MFQVKYMMMMVVMASPVMTSTGGGEGRAHHCLPLVDDGKVAEEDEEGHAGAAHQWPVH